MIQFKSYDIRNQKMKNDSDVDCGTNPKLIRRDRNNYGVYLLDMKRRHAHKEDGGTIRINVVINPLRPCLQHPTIRCRPLYLLVLRVPFIERSSPARIRHPNNNQSFNAN